MADYGLYFDGEDDYVSIPHSDSLNVTDFTVIVFSQFLGEGTAGKAYWTIIAKNNEGMGKYDMFHIGVHSNEHKIWARIGDGNSFPEIYGRTINVGENFCVVLRRNGTSIDLLLNNELQGSKTLSDYYSNTDPVILGKWEPYDNYYNGKIYLVLIYNRALSDTEIQQIYNDPTNPPTDGLVLWLAPDSVDTANDIWTDKSGQGNDGTIYGCLYIPTRWTTKDGVLTIEEIWELNTVRFNYPWPASIKNRINRVVEVMPTLNNTYVVFDKALGGEEVTFTFYLDPDYDDDENLRSLILQGGVIKVRTPDLRYYGDYVIKNTDWDIDAFNKYILKITAVRV